MRRVRLGPRPSSGPRRSKWIGPRRNCFDLGQLVKELPRGCRLAVPNPSVNRPQTDARRSRAFLRPGSRPAVDHLDSASDKDLPGFHGSEPTLADPARKTKRAPAMFSLGERSEHFRSTLPGFP